jgi:hypothetical protein
MKETQLVDGFWLVVAGERPFYCLPETSNP